MSAADVLSVVVGLLFLVTGGVKVVGLPQSLAIRDHFGMSAQLWRVIGVLECAGAVGALLSIWLRDLGLLALAGLAALMLGAVASRVRVRDPLPLMAFDVAVLVLVVVTFCARWSA
jgi:hypothetical protein